MDSAIERLTGEGDLVEVLITLWLCRSGGRTFFLIMKTIAEVAIGIVLLALVPIASLERFEEEDESVGLVRQKKGGLFLGLRGEERPLQPKKSDRPLRSSTETRIEQFLASCQPVYDFEEPSDSYFAAWMMERDAQVTMLSRKEKLQLLGEAYSLLDGVALFRPKWKPRLVERKMGEVRAGVRKALLLDEHKEPPSGFETPVFKGKRHTRDVFIIR